MGKLLVLVGAGLVAAGGGVYGLYTYTDVFGPRCVIEDCPVAKGRCCGGSDGCPLTADDPVQTAAIAAAGLAAAVTPTSPVSAEGKPAASYNCCADEPCAGK